MDSLISVVLKKLNPLTNFVYDLAEEALPQELRAEVYLYVNDFLVKLTDLSSMIYFPQLPLGIGDEEIVGGIPLSQLDIGDQDYWEKFKNGKIEPPPICDPGVGYRLPSGTGLIVCNRNGEWKGECIDGEVRFNGQTGLPMRCNEDNILIPWGGAMITRNSLEAFKQSQKLTSDFEEKYAVKLVAGPGYWTQGNISKLDKLFSLLPRNFFEGQVINLMAAGNPEGGYAEMGSSNVMPGSLGINSEGDIGVVIHELTHTKDELMGDFNFSASPEFLNFIFDHQAQWDEKTKQLSILIHGKEKIFEDETDYNCSLPNKEEFLACTATMYVLQPQKLCGDFPDLCELYQKSLFNGKSYMGIDVLTNVGVNSH
jgi:hypothetical protein